MHIYVYIYNHTYHKRMRASLGITSGQPSKKQRHGKQDWRCLDQIWYCTLMVINKGELLYIANYIIYYNINIYQSPQNVSTSLCATHLHMHGQHLIHLQHSNSIDFRASDPKLHSGFVLFPAVDPLEVGATCMQTAVEMVRSSTKRLEMLATKTFSCFFYLSNIEQHVCKCRTEWNRILIVLDHAGELWQSWPIGTRGIFFIFFRISMDFPSPATDCAPNYLKLQGIN